MVFHALRCDAGACQWRDGSTGAWQQLNNGTSLASTSAQLAIGSLVNHAWEVENSTTSLFWVYSKSLSDAEITQNFNYAAGVVAANGEGKTLDGSGN